MKKKKPSVIILTDDLEHIKKVGRGGYFIQKKHSLFVCDPHDFEDYLELRENRKHK